jgi:hypothetical protein
MYKNYNITPKGKVSVIANKNDEIQMITFGMNCKNIEGKLKGFKPMVNSYFSTNIEFKDKIVSSLMGIN